MGERFVSRYILLCTSGLYPDGDNEIIIIRTLQSTSKKSDYEV